MDRSSRGSAQRFAGVAAAVGDKFTRVINFGVDGMGMLQFAAMVRHHAIAFEPDLIIVNMISDSILRRIRYVGVPIPTNDRNEKIRLYVEEELLERGSIGSTHVRS